MLALATLATPLFTGTTLSSYPYITKVLLHCQVLFYTINWMLNRFTGETTMTKTNRYSATLAKLEKFINRYCIFSDQSYALPLSLWILSTFIHTDFDSLAYLCITASTKRAGKTRCAEIISFVCSNPVSSGALTPAAIYKQINEVHPTIFFDEAETLNSEAASTMRAILNMGYRKGSKVQRMKGEQVMEYDVYCPKVFILIGDVNDTLKDRSIIIRMKRADADQIPQRFVYEVAKTEGAEIRSELAEAIEENHSLLYENFVNFKGIEFLSDRDEEIWSPMFVICQTLFPERMKELERIATDITAEKTVDSATYRSLLGEGVEEKARDDEFARRLLADMATAINGEKHIPTMQLIERLHAIPTAPWRKYRGEGLNPHNLGDMMDRFHVQPKNLKIGKKVLKGYKLVDVKKALALIK